MNDDKKPLILIADDNSLNLKILENMLKRKGYQTVLAENGHQALELLQNQEPDIILLDIMMPGVNGIKVCQSLKEKESTKNIPVLFITALSDTKDKLKAFRAGGVDYITKPFIQEEVLARINVHIELKKAMERLKALSVTDEMTGVFNRRWAYEILAKQIEITNREGSSLVVCYIDIDHLKIINDNYGHAEGDRLINTVVNVLKNVIRTSDYIFRMGGDEFLLIFPKAKLTDSDNMIKRIRESLRDKKMKDIPIDFSFGFSEFQAKDNLLPDELIKMADSNMYKQKTKKKRDVVIES